MVEFWKPYYSSNKSNRNKDDRGFFERLFDFDELGFVPKQVNISVTDFKGTVRGMHLLKKPYAETKFVKVIKGKIFDCLVNLDIASRGFGTVISVELGESDMIKIPPYHAHGFQALVNDVVIAYAVDQSYQQSADAGISPFSREVLQLWPLSVSKVSNRDLFLPAEIPSKGF